MAAVIHLKGGVTLLSLVIHSFIKSLIGEIIAIMYSGNDTVELELTFHEQIVLTFAVHVSTINEGKRLKSVLDYWINIRLLRVDWILFSLVWLSFRSVAFCLSKVAYHRFVL